MAHYRKDGGIDRRYKNNSAPVPRGGCAGMLLLLMIPVALLIALI